MSEKKATTCFGRQVYGLGVMALSMVCLAWGDFDPGQPVPKNFPDRSTLAYAAAVFMLSAGAAIEWRRIRAWGSASLVMYYTVIVVIVMNGRLLPAHYAEFGTYSGIAEQAAIAAAALIIFASSARMHIAGRLMRIGQRTFGVCAVLFGGAHFFYVNLTVPLIPQWLPPNPVFWAYATGIAHIVGGVAILTGVQARLAALLLTIMYASFTALVHLPMLLADYASHVIWSENALNLALIGSAWVVADSLAPRV